MRPGAAIISASCGARAIGIDRVGLEVGELAAIDFSGASEVLRGTGPGDPGKEDEVLAELEVKMNFLRLMQARFPARRCIYRG